MNALAGNSMHPPSSYAPTEEREGDAANKPTHEEAKHALVTSECSSSRSAAEGTFVAGLGGNAFTRTDLPWIGARRSPRPAEVQRPGKNGHEPVQFRQDYRLVVGGA